MNRFKSGDIIVNKITKDIYIYKNKINPVLFSFYTKLAPNGKCVIVPNDGSTHCAPISDNLCKAGKEEVERLNMTLDKFGMKYHYKK